MKLFFVFGFVFSALFVHDVQCWWFGFKDVGKSLEDAGTNILDKVSDAIPSSVIDAGKSVVDAGSDILDKVPDIDDVGKSIADAGTDIINKVPDVIPSSVKDVSKSVVDAGTGILNKIPDVLPSTEGLIQMGKNVLAGYPFDVAFSIINAFCAWNSLYLQFFFRSSNNNGMSFLWLGSAALVTKTVQPRFTPNISSMNFVLRYDHKDYLIPLNKPELLWKHEKFNPTWPTVLLATGWKTNYNESANQALDQLYEAYHCRGKINFVVSVACINLCAIVKPIERAPTYSFNRYLCRRSTVRHSSILCIRGLHSIPTRSVWKSLTLSSYSFAHTRSRIFIWLDTVSALI